MKTIRVDRNISFCWCHESNTFSDLKTLHYLSSTILLTLLILFTLMQCTLDAQNTRKYKYPFHAAISFDCLMGGTDSSFLVIEEWNSKCTAVNLALLLKVWMQRPILEPPIVECNSLKSNIVTNPDILSAFKCKSTYDSILSAKRACVIWFTRQKTKESYQRTVSVFSEQ